MVNSKEIPNVGNFFKTYYIFILLIAIWEIIIEKNHLSFPTISSIMLKPINQITLQDRLIAGASLMILLAVLILSAMALEKFSDKKLPKITLIIPIYRIIRTGLAVFGVLFLGFAFQGATPNDVINLDLGLGIILPIVEIILIGFMSYSIFYISKK